MRLHPGLRARWLNVYSMGRAAGGMLMGNRHARPTDQWRVQERSVTAVLVESGRCLESRDGASRRKIRSVGGGCRAAATIGKPKDILDAPSWCLQ